jgi:hypothetical protein
MTRNGKVRCGFGARGFYHEGTKSTKEEEGIGRGENDY